MDYFIFVFVLFTDLRTFNFYSFLFNIKNPVFKLLNNIFIFNFHSYSKTIFLLLKGQSNYICKSISVLIV